MTDADTVQFVVDASGRKLAPSRLPVDSLSLGRGVFETVLFLSGKPVFAREHEARLRASCAELAIASDEEARGIFRVGLVRAAQRPLAAARGRIAVFAPSHRGSAAGLIALEKAGPAPVSVSLMISDARRSSDEPLYRHKTVNYLANLLLREDARRCGYDDAVILDTDGNVAEASVANMFLRVGGGLVTPKAGPVLPGIVRAWVLENAGGAGAFVEERDVPSSALDTCDFAFATNSIIGLVPVSRILTRNLLPASEVSWFQRLSKAYRQVLDSASSGAPAP